MALPLVLLARLGVVLGGKAVALGIFLPVIVFLGRACFFDFMFFYVLVCKKNMAFSLFVFLQWQGQLALFVFGSVSGPVESEVG